KKLEVTTDPDLRIDTLENQESDIFGKLHLKIYNNYNHVVNLTMNFSATELTAKCDDIYEVMCETGDHSELTSCFNYLLCIDQRFKKSKTLDSTRDLMLDYIIYKLNRLDNILYGEARPYHVKKPTHITFISNELNRNRLFSCGRILYTADKRLLVQSLYLSQYDKKRPNYFIGRNIIINIVGSMLNFKTSAIDRVIYAIDANWGIDRFNDNIIMDEKVYSKLKPGIEAIRVESESESDDSSDSDSDDDSDSDLDSNSDDDSDSDSDDNPDE
ncbi:hypothetical protein NEIG_01520, partial [Nematocida sp. ERTm5]